VASQFHIPEAIEPFSADMVGAERHIVLGKKSGLDSITLKARELGLDVPDSSRAAVLNAVKNKGVSARRLVSDAEFREIVEQVHGAAARTVHSS
jgi:isopropylmalate/homocitrate/citramalate synthase